MIRKRVLTLSTIGGGGLLGVLVPYTMSSYYVSLVSLVLVWAILAASVNFLAGHSDLITMGHAGIAGVAGYSYAWAVHADWGMAASLALVTVLTVAVSFLYGLMSMRANGIFFIMITLALGMVIFGLAYRLAPITGGENGLSGLRRPEPIAEYWQFYFFVFAAFVACTLLLWVVGRSPFGTVLRGIRDSESRMLSLGYSTTRYKLAAMMISGPVAGLSGLLAVWNTQYISPSSADFISNAIPVVMIILGGVGTTMGPLVGASIVVWIEHVLSTSVDRWPMVLGLVFILVILFAPKGLIGGLHRLLERRRNRRRPETSDDAPPPAPATRADPS